MKAIIYTEYGNPGVLKIQDIPKPVPKDGEVLIKVKAIGVNIGDLMARNFKNISARKFNMPFLFWVFARLSFGINKPRIRVLGNSFSGEIESVGRGVSQYRQGEPVFGYTGEKMGAYSEFVCMPAKGIISPKPLTVSFAEAAALPYGTLMAFKLLQKVKIKQGQKVLVVGASGSIGSAAVQLLKNHLGAVVHGVCSSKRMDYLKKLGVETVFDYEKNDYTGINDTYDLIFDVPGKGSFSDYKSMLTKNGTCLYASFKTKKILQMLWTGLTGNKKVVCALASPKDKDLILIKQLVDEDKIKSVIDKSFPIEQAAFAHEYIENHNNAGYVILTIG